MPLGDEPDYFHRYSEFLLNFDKFLVNQQNFSQALTCNKNYLVGELFDLYLKISPFFVIMSQKRFGKESFLELF